MVSGGRQGRSVGLGATRRPCGAGLPPGPAAPLSAPPKFPGEQNWTPFGLTHSTTMEILSGTFHFCSPEPFHFCSPGNSGNGGRRLRRALAEELKG